MKQTKRRFEPFAFYNSTGICRHLERMAAKGWMLTRMSTLWWTYRRTEPRKLHFAISYLATLSMFDPDDLEERQEFLDYCTHGGWHLACSAAQAHVFWNEEENPTPLETDPELELESIRASAWKGFLLGNSLLLGISLLQIFLFAMLYLGNPINFLSNSLLIYALTCFLIAAALTITELVCYSRWSSKAEKMAPLGSLPQPVDTRYLGKGVTYLLVFLLLVEVVRGICSGQQTSLWMMAIPGCLLILLLSQIMQAMRDWLRRRGASRGLNRALVAVFWITGSLAYFVGISFLRPAANAAELAIRGAETYTVQGESYTAYQDAVPLSLEELTGAQTGSYSTRRTGDQTIFLSRYSVTQEPRLDAQNQDELPSLRYTVYSIFWPGLYEICKRDLLETGVLMEQYILYSYVPADPTPWGAEEVFQRLNNAGGLENEFLLCYDNTLATIEFSWTPTQEQMELAGKELALSADFGIW